MAEFNKERNEGPSKNIYIQSEITKHTAFEMSVGQM